MMIPSAIFMAGLFEHTLLGLTVLIKQDTELNSEKVILHWGIKAERAQRSITWVLEFYLPEFEPCPCYFTAAV